MNAPINKDDKGKRWNFITNHALVFFYVAEHPDSTIRQIANELSLGWRTVAGILADLRAEGYIQSFRVGKSNLYRVDTTLGLRREPYSNYSLADFFTIFNKPSDQQPS